MFTTFHCLLNTPTALVIDFVLSHSHQLRSNSKSTSVLNMMLIVNLGFEVTKSGWNEVLCHEYNYFLTQNVINELS